MKAPRVLALVLGFLALCLAGILLLGGSLDADGSTLSRGSGGWLAARRYLEASGCRVRLQDGPSREAAPGAVLVVSFPWQRFDPWERLEPARLRAHLLGHLRRGGTLLLAFSRRPGPVERVVVESLGFGWRDVRGEAPLGPLKWWAYQREGWALVPVMTSGEGRSPIRIRALRRVPRMPDAARELLRGPGGVPMAFAVPLLAGRVVALPAEVLSNARLGQAGSADLLETVRANAGEEWVFDEYHHGLSAPAEPGASRSQHVLDLWLAHLALIYLLAVLALSRRFGPAWRDPPPMTGSTGSFLLGLGALHHRLGHHREAAQALLGRAVEMSPWLSVPELARRRAEEADAESFLSLARDLALAQGRGRRQA